MLDYQKQWKDGRDAQTVWVSREALELKLKNEKEFFKRTVRGRAFQAEWKALVPQSMWHSRELTEVQLEIQRTKEQGVRLTVCQLLTVF